MVENAYRDPGCSANMCIERGEVNIMRRIISAFMIAAVLTVAVPAFASEIDVTSLDFETLSDLKEKVDAEYKSRPEAEPFTLNVGYYTVGTDLKSGSYYMASVIPDESGYSTRLHVYANKEQFGARPSGKYGDYIYDSYFSLGEQPKNFILEEGNYLYLQNGQLLVSPTVFDTTEYYSFEMPEGTYVAAGAYEVGDDKDLPAGTYTAYPASLSGGEFKIYFTKEAFAEDGSWHFGYDSHREVEVTDKVESETFVLEDGYILLVEKDIVMRKGTGGSKLVFD